MFSGRCVDSNGRMDFSFYASLQWRSKLKPPFRPWIDNILVQNELHKASGTHLFWTYCVLYLVSYNRVTAKKQVTRATSSLGFRVTVLNFSGFETLPECQWISRQAVEHLSKQWSHFDATEYHPNRRKHDARRHLKLNFQRIVWWSLTTHATPKPNSSLLSKCLHFAEFEFIKICVYA